MSREISLISIDGDPLAPNGGRQQRGQDGYVKELSRYLGAFGLKIDVYCRWNNDQLLSQEDFSRGARVIRIPIDTPEDIGKEKSIQYLKDIATWIPTFQIKQGLHYSLVHSQSYLSGPVGIHLKDIWGIPHVHSFHSLGYVEEEVFGSNIQGTTPRNKIEKLICSKADRIITSNHQDLIDLTELYQVDHTLWCKSGNLPTSPPIRVPPGYCLPR